MSDVYLSIDTSSSDTFVSIYQSQNDLLISSSCTSKDSHNEELASLVNNALTQSGIAPQAITHLLYGLGPGSFTGLRIGLSFVKGFILGCSEHCSLGAVSSLSAVSFGSHIKTSSRYCGAIADARRGEVFCVLYDTKTMKEVLPLGIRTLDLYLSEARRISEDINVVDCSGGESLGIGFHKLTSISESLIALYRAVPGVFSVGHLNPEELSQVEPLYLRAVAAKTILERKSA